MTYHYIRSEPNLPDSWIVGTGQPGVDWAPESEHSSPSAAIARVRSLNGGTVELTPLLARKGHCTLGGTIASGEAVCQCGAWAAADYPDAETRKATRKEHLNLVGEMRRAVRGAQDHDIHMATDVETLRRLVNSPIQRRGDV